MAKAFLKLVLLAIIVALVLWNLVWRQTTTVPILSNISSTVIYIIAGAVLLIEIGVNLSTRKQKK
jgi:predicted transporter